MAFSINQNYDNTFCTLPTAKQYTLILYIYKNYVSAILITYSSRWVTDYHLCLRLIILFLQQKKQRRVRGFFSEKFYLIP